jgi:hypothetical protein
MCRRLMRFHRPDRRAVRAPRRRLSDIFLTSTIESLDQTVCNAVRPP